MVIPGTIAAQNFDNGGEGVAYHDTSSTNEGGAYRQSGVDLEACSEGGNSVGWIAAGEWINYTVNVASAGTYTATFRVASLGTGGTFHLEMNGSNVSGTLAIPNTNGWQSWTNIYATVSLNAGQQIAHVVMDTVGSTGAVGNLSYVRFDSASTPAPAPAPSGPTPFAGVISLPGTVQAENFDNGGEGVAYHDVTGGNSGESFRSTDVDLEPASGGSYDVGWTSAGEWLKYTVNVAATGTYTLSFRVASSGQGGAFHLEMNDRTVTSGLAIPSTGGWQNWTIVSQSVSLVAGQQIAKLVFDGGYGNVDSFEVSAPAAPAPSPSGGGGTFRVMTWNIQHGFTASGSYDVYSQAQFIVSQNPDVVLLQEVQTWDENQPPRFQSLLQQMTGQTWTLVWAPVVNVAGTEGNVILTRLPVVNSGYYQLHATGDYSALLSNRSAAWAQLRLGSVDINVYSTHLDYSNTTWRTIQLQQLMSWLSYFGATRLVGGDFNSWWGEQWISTMESQYSDTWRDVTGSNENGYTHSGVRFDYIFRSYDGGSHATPTNVYVPATSLSDHYPVIADFRVQ
jgi:endonuclease/exonuclease/phosphatase family metal-dependent hydrolase